MLSIGYARPFAIPRSTTNVGCAPAPRVAASQAVAADPAETAMEVLMRVDCSMSLSKMSCIAAMLIITPLVVIPETAWARQSGGGTSTTSTQHAACRSIYGFCQDACFARSGTQRDGFSRSLGLKLCADGCSKNFEACMDATRIGKSKPAKPVVTSGKPGRQSGPSPSRGKSKPPERGLYGSRQGPIASTGPAASSSQRGSGGGGSRAQR